MSLKGWARKELRHGDLSELSHLAKNGWVQPDPDRTQRLTYRGFLAKKSDDTFKVTLRGRAALWVRRRSR